MKFSISTVAMLALSFTMLTGAKKCENTSEPTSCVCASIFAPVCASDGNTYGNACEAECQGLTVESNDECDYTLDGNGEPCVGDVTFDECNEGQSCIVYSTFSGQPTASCHVDCAFPGEPGGGSAICPTGLQCVTVADGPGSVCIEIE